MSQPSGRKPPIRDEKTGRLQPGGGSLNPGGQPARVARIRRALLSKKRGLDPVAALKSLLDDENPIARAQGVKLLLDHGLGRPPAADELHDETPLPEPTDLTPTTLVQRALFVVERLIARDEVRLLRGGFSEAQAAAAAGRLQMLTGVLKEERELAKAAPGADLPDDKLIAAVLQAIPTEKLRALLREREAMPS